MIDISLLYLYNKMHQFFLAYFGVEATSVVSTFKSAIKGRIHWILIFGKEALLVLLYEYSCLYYYFWLLHVCNMWWPSEIIQDNDIIRRFDTTVNIKWRFPLRIHLSSFSFHVCRVFCMQNWVNLFFFWDLHIKLCRVLLL